MNSLEARELNMVFVVLEDTQTVRWLRLESRNKMHQDCFVRTLAGILGQNHERLF